MAKPKSRRPSAFPILIASFFGEISSSAWAAPKEPDARTVANLAITVLGIVLLFGTLIAAFIKRSRSRPPPRFEPAPSVISERAPSLLNDLKKLNAWRDSLPLIQSLVGDEPLISWVQIRPISNQSIQIKNLKDAFTAHEVVLARTQYEFYICRVDGQPRLYDFVRVPFSEIEKIVEKQFLGTRRYDVSCRDGKGFAILSERFVGSFDSPDAKRHFEMLEFLHKWAHA